MCGVIATAANNDIVLALIEGFKIEYQSYDSAGLAFMGNNFIECIRFVGRVAELKAASPNTNLNTNISMAPNKDLLEKFKTNLLGGPSTRP